MKVAQKREQLHQSSLLAELQRSCTRLLKWWCRAGGRRAGGRTGGDGGRASTFHRYRSTDLISHRILTKFAECIHFMIISDEFAYERFPMIITGVIALELNFVNFLSLPLYRLGFSSDFHQICWVHTFHDYLGWVRKWAISDDYYRSYCPWTEFRQLFIITAIQTSFLIGF